MTTPGIGIMVTLNDEFLQQLIRMPTREKTEEKKTTKKLEKESLLS